jgi:hypothetical protein
MATRVFDLSMGLPAKLDQTVDARNATVPALSADPPAIPTDAVVDQDPCLLPVVVAMRTAPNTRDQTWTVDPAVQHLFDLDLDAAFAWARDNHELQIGLATADDIVAKWQKIVGKGEPPELTPRDYCIIYRWAVDFEWARMGAGARTALFDVPCGGGNCLPIYVKGAARATELHGLVALHFDAGDRSFVLSGAPHPSTTIVETVRRLHAGEGRSVPVGPEDEVQLIPVEFVGCPETSTALMGLGRLVGSTTETHEVVAAAGNCAVAIDVQGIRAEAMGYVIVRYRSIAVNVNPPGRWNFHDEKGNQWLRLTVIKDGRVEFGIELGNRHHKPGK